MDVIKYPIINIAFSFGLGIIIQKLLAFAITPLLISLIIFLVLFSFLYFIEQHKNTKTILFGLSAYLLIVTIGSISLYFHQESSNPNLYSKIDFKKINKVEGLVISELKPNAFYTKYVMQIHVFNNQKSSGKILLYFSKKNKKTLSIGDKIITNTKVSPILKNYNPYGFDYANYMENQNIFHQIKCFENTYFIGNKVKNTSYYIYKIRQKLMSSFDVHHFSIKTKSIINALLFGQKQELDQSIMNDYKNAGVIHILAISGLHIGIIYGFLNFFFGFLNRIKNGKTIKLAAILFLLWLFALISGMSASVTRAVLMFSIIAFGNFLNTRNSIFNAIATSFLILLIYNPLYLFDVGFQLSYAAVLAIVLFQPFYGKFYFNKHKTTIYVSNLFLVSMAAQLGVLPLMLLYFKQVPTLFLLANLVAIPAATLVLITGIITLISNFLFTPVALLFGKIITLIVTFMNNYIQWLAGFEPFIIKNVSFTSVLAFLLYGILITFIYWMYQPKNKRFLYLLFFILSFQLVYFTTKKQALSQNELIVFNHKESVISVLNYNALTVYSNDSLIKQNQSVWQYANAKFKPKIQFKPLDNLFYFKGKKILIVDKNGIYNTSIKPNVVILRQNAYINLERLILSTKPSLIIADKSNSFTSLKRWKAICLHYKIPFHAIAEKGFYKM